MSISAKRVYSIFRRNLFNNRVAIVTGGSTGIGKAIAYELLYLGCRVVIASRNEGRLQQVATEMNCDFPSVTTQANATAIPCNIKKEDQIQNLVAKTLSVYGKIDFLVNNGGGQFLSPVANMNIKGWNAVIETNLTGTFLMCKEVFNTWMNEHGGSIVNIVAENSRGFPMAGHTAAARAGIENLTKTLSVEWAENGVRINAVIPGVIYSETAVANYSGGSDMFERARTGIATKRLGTPEEISAGVCYLLSPAAAFITGSSLKIDGGSSLYSHAYWIIPEHDRLPAYDWNKQREGHDDSEPDSKSKL